MAGIQCPPEQQGCSPGFLKIVYSSLIKKPLMELKTTAFINLAGFSAGLISAARKPCPRPKPG